MFLIAFRHIFIYHVHTYSYL